MLNPRSCIFKDLRRPRFPWLEQTETALFLGGYLCPSYVPGNAIIQVGTCINNNVGQAWWHTPFRICASEDFGLLGETVEPATEMMSSNCNCIALEHSQVW